MKKFFEKHDLFKLVGICLLVVIALTWFVKQGAFSGSQYQVDESLYRIGLFDITTYGSVVIREFFINIVFVFAVAGFYKVLGSMGAYRAMINKIALAFKGKEKVFVAISTLVFACLAGLLNDYFALIALVPFAISILTELKVDKVSGVSATFGGIIIGLLGSTYGTVSGDLANQYLNSSQGLGLTYGNELMATLILFAIGYLLLTYLTFARMNSLAKKKKVALLEDPFATIVVEKKEKKDSKKGKKEKKPKVKAPSIVPLAIILGVVLVILVLAYVPWVDAFNVEVFNDFYTYVTEATLFGSDVPFMSVILGSVMTAFGSWDLLTFVGLLFLALIVIKIVYHIPFDKVIDEFGEGCKKITGSVVILVMLYSVLLFAVNFLTYTAIINFITNAGNNIFTIFTSGIVSSIFANDFLQSVNILTSFVVGFNTPSIAGLALQAANGLISFVSPTSIALIFGLSMLDVKYTDWLKYIWKFALAMLVIILIVLAILVYV